MFLVLATKPLNDGTRGFRFNALGVKGVVRLRKAKSRYGMGLKTCTYGVHVAKLSLYVETKTNRQRDNKRRLHHFAG